MAFAERARPRAPPPESTAEDSYGELHQSFLHPALNKRAFEALVGKVWARNDIEPATPASEVLRRADADCPHAWLGIPSPTRPLDHIATFGIAVHRVPCAPRHAMHPAPCAPVSMGGSPLACRMHVNHRGFKALGMCGHGLSTSRVADGAHEMPSAWHRISCACKSARRMVACEPRSVSCGCRPPHCEVCGIMHTSCSVACSL